MQHDYDSSFLKYAADSSSVAAQVVTANLSRLLQPRSVLDIGCAYGTWLGHWREHGVHDIYGVDGPYVEKEKLSISPASFRTANLSEPVSLGRQFDLVMSLEVGEHIPESASDVFVDTITTHADRYVLFSAAPPGQGGEFHINEKPYQFWRDRFARRGFVIFDCIRPVILKDKRISYWYRYNTFLYVRKALSDSLPDSIKATFVPDETNLTDVSPPLFRLRKSIIRRMPPTFQNSLARLKSRALPTGRF